MMERWRSVILPLLVALALVVTACAGGATPEAAEEAAPAATEAEEPAGAAAEAEEPAEEAAEAEEPAEEAAEAEEPAEEAAEAEESAEAASTEPIKIGMLTDLTSTFTPWGLN